MIVANVDEDSRHAADIARVAGFSPKSILCVPLVNNDRVIGVLEVLDKQRGEPFLPRDMECFELFAKWASVAMALPPTGHTLTALLTLSVTGATGSTDEETRALVEA